MALSYHPVINGDLPVAAKNSADFWGWRGYPQTCLTLILTDLSPCLAPCLTGPAHCLPPCLALTDLRSDLTPA